MGQLIVRNLENDIKERLKRRARRHGQSMEEEARAILRDALKHESETPVSLGSRLAARFADIGLDKDIEEQRGTPARPADFE